MLAYAAAVPYSCVTIWEANLKREYEAATDWQTRIRAAAELVESGPANLKHALDVNGYYGGNPRLPLTAITQERKVRVEADLEGLVQRA
jgi:4-hydroxy-2-oxoglutarate aldolase